GQKNWDFVESKLLAFTRRCTNINGGWVSPRAPNSSYRNHEVAKGRGRKTFFTHAVNLSQHIGIQAKSCVNPKPPVIPRTKANGARDIFFNQPRQHVHGFYRIGGKAECTH